MANINLTSGILVLALAVLGGLMIGYFFAKKIKARKNYYKNLVALTGDILSEVKFLRNDIAKVMQNFLDKGESGISTNVTEYLEFLRTGNLNLSKGVLSNTELKLVTEFFLSIGGLDADTQLFSLGMYNDKFLQEYSEIKERTKKTFGMYIKLGLLSGLALGIILL